MELSHKYESECLELKTKITDTREKFSKINKEHTEETCFTNAVYRFISMQVLTPTSLRKLIDRIEVHETEGTDKNRTQRIVIYYNKFAGYIEILGAPTRKHYKTNIRQGIAIEYIPEAFA